MKKITTKLMNGIAIGLTLAFAVLGLSGVAAAQETRIESPYLQGQDLKTAVETARERHVNTTAKGTREIKPDDTDTSGTNAFINPNLVGTWNVTVTGAGPNPFFSMQTFNSGGTFTETSSQLGKLREGPAHGVYSCGTHTCNLTFETFEFDPDGNYVGKIRLRALITQTTPTAFIAQYSVDFINLDGSIDADIGSGTLSGTKMQVLGL